MKVYIYIKKKLNRITGSLIEHMLLNASVNIFEIFSDQLEIGIADVVTLMFLTRI
jgi:hypothetical protein